MLALSEEQQLIRDSAARVVRANTVSGLPKQRDCAAPVWSSMVELGWVALAVSSQQGGMGGSALDLCALAAELGSALMVGSFAIECVLAGEILARASPSSVRDASVTELLAGNRTLAVAGASTAVPELQARWDAGGWLLEGTARNVWVSGLTRELLVCADTGEGGDLLAVIPLRAPGVAISQFPTVDRGLAVDGSFAGVHVPAEALLADPGPQARAIRERAWDLATLVTVAECVGMMRSLLERTAEHLRTRKQFGKPLAQFQALRHRMADMVLAMRRAEVLAERVAREFANLAPAERTAAVAAAGVKGLAGLRFVAEQAIQLHGGMGISAELPIGNFVRRSIALEATFGCPDQHRIRFQEFAS